MNIWDYFEREAKKYECIAKFAQKHPRISAKDFSSSWNLLTIHLLAFQNDHLPILVPNNAHEKEKLL